MVIKKVWVEDDCTSCGLCEDLCPKVFKMEDIATVIIGADFKENEDQIKEAAESCPVGVIKFEEE
jgi:ferredoxin